MNTVSITSTWSIFLIFLKLGLTSFGGPIAHLGYFREEFVVRRQWLSEQSYADLVALCQFLPGPASSQIGIALGSMRAGYIGAIMAWLGFTLPSALFLIVCGLGVVTYANAIPQGLLHGFKLVAVAIVAQAVWGMAKNLCRNTSTVSIMLFSACVLLCFNAIWLQIALMTTMALVGAVIFQSTSNQQIEQQMTAPIQKPVAVLWLAVFLSGLIILPIMAAILTHKTIAIIDTFYRSGALVFGGGHAVLPFLQTEMLTNHWVNHDVFLTGYGLAQIVPGPLFSFSAFLGATMSDMGNAWLSGIIALLAIFTPSFFLVFSALPFWQLLRQNCRMQGALTAVNACVVGILLSTLYQPVWTSAIFNGKDFALALSAFVALVVWKWPPWLVVFVTSLLTWFTTLF